MSSKLFGRARRYALPLAGPAALIVAADAQHFVALDAA
jgi:hypothetical protein